ncbi:MAG: hypothetical protein HXY42_06785 [Chloroflexi bacterium]|nr:hypothetical protein [Chloroflexota bacterium]
MTTRLDLILTRHGATPLTVRADQPNHPRQYLSPWRDLPTQPPSDTFHAEGGK